MNEKKIYADDVEFAYQTGRQDVLGEVSKLIEKHRKNMNKIDIGPNVETIKALIAEWFDFEIDIIALKEGKDDTA